MKLSSRVGGRVPVVAGLVLFGVFMALAASPSRPWMSALAMHGAWLLAVLVTVFFSRTGPGADDDEP